MAGGSPSGGEFAAAVTPHSRSSLLKAFPANMDDLGKFARPERNTEPAACERACVLLA